MNNNSSKKSRFWTAVLCLFFGYLGIHRFYTGHILVGFIFLFTGGLFGFGYIYDLACLLLGIYSDSDGNNLD